MARKRRTLRPDTKLLPKTRFYADHNIPDGVVTALRHQGISIITAGERDKRRAEDPDHYAEAKRLGRILLTHDRDFLDRKKFTPRGGTGIVVIDGGSDDLLKLVQIYRVLLLMRRGHENWTNTVMDIKKDGSIHVRWWEKEEGREYVARYKLGTHYLVEL